MSRGHTSKETAMDQDHWDQDTRDQGRREQGRRDEGRRDEGRRDEGRRDEGRREQDRRERAPILPVSQQDQQGQQGQQGPSTNEVRGVVIFSKIGKTLCAAFAFQNQNQEQQEEPQQQQQQQEQQQLRVRDNGPHYEPLQTEVVEESTPPPNRESSSSRFGTHQMWVYIFIILFLLGIIAFLGLRAVGAGGLGDNWEDEEEWVHVHKLYAKRSISIAPGKQSNWDFIPENGLVDRDASRRRVPGRINMERNVGDLSTSPQRRIAFEIPETIGSTVKEISDLVGNEPQVLEKDTVVNEPQVKEKEMVGNEPQVKEKEPGGHDASLFPLRGNVYPDGLYYMQLLVGNPPKPYYVDLDTGSDLTWLQCDAPCSNCAQTPHPLYRPQAAKLVDCRQPACALLQKGSPYGCSSGKGQCDYEIEYGDSSSTIGVLVADEITMLLTNGTTAQTKAVFGCSYDQHGSLAESPAKTDGLLGLSSSRLALPAQLASKGLIKNVFAHCLADDTHGGGYFFLGDDLVPTWGMTWAPLVHKPDNDNYFISVSNLQYGLSTLELNDAASQGNDFIFDSGTSYTYFVPRVYSAFIKAIEESLQDTDLERDTEDKTLPYCWKRDVPFSSVSDASRYFRSVTLNFKTHWYLTSRQMVMDPQSYLILTEEGNVCMGIMDASEIDSPDNIIGDISLRGKLVVYDNVKHQIGWMASTCQRPPKARFFTFV